MWKLIVILAIVLIILIGLLILFIEKSNSSNKEWKKKLYKFLYGVTVVGLSLWFGLILSVVEKLVELPVKERKTITEYKELKIRIEEALFTDENTHDSYQDDLLKIGFEMRKDTVEFFKKHTNFKY